MNEQQHAAYRRHHACPNCGGVGLEEEDGSKCGGMPGITYRVCRGCGYASAKVKRPKREKLREDNKDERK